MQNFRGTFVNKNRDAWVEVNLANLEHNVLKIKEHLKKNCEKMPEILAVIKADAYGHGSLMCAPILNACGISYFGVASVDEGIELRENKITKPILVLGATPLWALENAIKNDIMVSIFNDEHLEAANQLHQRLNKKLKVHIKLDTGMNRIGVSSNSSRDFIQKALQTDSIQIDGIFTHFADVENELLFKRQITEFNKTIEEFKNVFNNIKAKIHCLNSPAILMHHEYSYDMVRMGIIMWGLTPFSKDNALFNEFLPVIGLKARITNLHTLKKDDGISYGHTYVAQENIKVATIPIGYADGLDRKLSGKITAYLNGKKIQQIGRITMDQVMFDVSNTDCQIGDVIVLLGQENTSQNIEDWANALDTINYELTCRLKMRLPRIYVR